MAEIEPDLLEEFQKPAELAFEGRLIQSQAPPEPVFIERQGFFGNVRDIAQRSSVASFYQWQTDNLYHGDDPNFDLKSYLDQNPDRQPYAHIFSDARTQRYADDRWDRFKRNLQLDQRIADSEAFWSRLVIDIGTDPLNLIPGAGLRRGVGIIEGVVRGAGASLPASAVDAAIRMKYDPNASFDDVKEQFLYTTAIMGVLGGGIGMLKPGRDVSGLAKDLIDESRRLAGEPPVGYKPKNPGDESPVVLHTVPHDATGSYRPFEAQATGDMPVGFAPAYGLEKIAGQQSAFARLANAGYRATEDLANRLAGDYGVRFARAERFEAPEPSASLAATKWSAEAGDAISKIRNAHARYLTGGTESLEIAGINVRSTLAGVGDTFRGIFDRKRPDEKLTFQEFKEEIFKAHRADRIEHPIPEVEEAAKAIRPFFDNILQAQLKAGYIRNPTWAMGYRGRLTAELNEIRQQIQELQSNQSRSVNQEALLLKLNDHVKLVENELNDVTAMLNTWSSTSKTGEPVNLGADVFAGPVRRQTAIANDNVLATLGVRQLDRNDPQFEPTANDNTVFDSWQDRIKEPVNITDGQYQRLNNTVLPVVPDSKMLRQLEKEVSWLINLEEKRLEFDDPFMDVIDDASSKASKYEPLNISIDNVRNQLEVEIKDARLKEYEQFFKSQNINMISDLPNILDELDFGNFADIRMKLFDSLGKDYYKFNEIFNKYENIILDVNRIIDEFSLPNVEKYKTGQPVIADVFHGTSAPLINNKFSPEFLGKNTGAPSAEEGFFFSQSPKTANTYARMESGSNIIQARIRMENPFVYDFKGSFYREESYFELMQKAKNEGHDGVIFLNTLDGGRKDIIYSVWDPEKIRYTNDIGNIVNSIFGPQVLKGRVNIPTPANDIRVSQPTSKIGGVGVREPANINYEPFTGPEKYYLPRIFLPEQVAAKADTVRKTMIDWYSNPENYPDGIAPKRSEIVDRVDSEMNGMMKLGTMPGPSSNRPSFTRSRSIDIPNEVFADIGVIDLDISNVMQYYSRRAGMGLEYSRAFGSPDANLSISRTMLRVAEESKAGTVDDILKEIENLKGEAENIRDIQLGTIFAENADSIGRRSSSLIRSWFAVTSMGGALMNSLMEMVRPAMVLGIRNNFDFALKALGNVESLKKMSSEQREKLTAAHELAAGQTFRRFFDNGIDAGVAISRTSKMLEKVEGPLAYLARTPLYLLNGVGALTHYQKQFTGFLGSDMFAQRIMRVADNTASKDDALFLVDYGISLDDARKMATMPIEKDKGIMFANTAAWPDKDLADKFYQAVQALQERVITTPSTADKPSVMMGILGKGTTRKEASMLGVPFQLKSWGFAANNKILLSGLQGRDANLMSGVLMLFGAGYLVSSLKTPETMWNNMSADEQILMGIEASGVLGLYGDLNFMIEQMSQDSIGLRPLMSMDPKRGKSDQYDAIGEVFGPGPSKMLDIYKSFSSPYSTSRDRANSVIRSIPFNNLIWIPQSFRALGRDTLQGVL